MFHRFNRECCTLFFSVWHSDVFPFSFWLVVHRFLLLLWTVNLCWCFVLLWRIRCVFLAESSVILRGWLKALCSVSADSESVGQHTSASPQSSARTDTPSLVCLSDSFRLPAEAQHIGPLILHHVCSDFTTELSVCLMNAGKCVLSTILCFQKEF